MKWREQRVARLTSENGWLTLVGLFWLKPGENTFGRNHRNAIVLDHPQLAKRAGAFTRTPLVRRTAPGRFTAEVPWKPGDVMEFRAVVRHPLLETFSIEQRANVP